jgi:AraC-like DNA-binding protein
MISDPESHIAATSMCKLLEESAENSDCATFGLAMAESRTFASLGPLALLLEHLGSIRNVVEALTEYRRHLNDVVILGVEEGEGDQVLRVELLAKFATPQTADLAIGVAYVALRGASRFRWQPLEVHFSHSEPDDSERFKRFFQVPIRFESSFNGFISSNNSMSGEWPWANGTMASHARRLLTLVPLEPEQAPVTESVMRLVSLSLPSGHATLSDIAARLGKSPRSLQRSIAHEGRCFADLLNEVRRSLVVQHLSASNCSMTSIASMLGFFSSSSFSRWFLLEFGVAPRVWRSQQLRAAETNVL